MITFQYNTTVVTLRNPDLGDSYQGTLGTAFRTSMTGAFFTYRKTPNHIRLLLNFTDVECIGLDDFKEFLELAAGQVVLYTDYNGVIYSGYILNNPLEFNSVARYTTTFTVEFQVISVIPAPSIPTIAMLLEDGELMLLEDLETMLLEG